MVPLGWLGRGSGWARTTLKQTLLDRLLKPQSIAVFGGGWAEEVVRQCHRIGYQGEIWPVHPDKAAIEGHHCYRSLAELPGVPDAAFVAINRHATVDLIRDLNAAGAGGAVCFASGFKEAGAGGADLQRELLDAAGPMPFLGPNCYGFLNYFDRALLWPDQHGGETVSRGVALISQSGNIGVSLTMQRRGLPLGYLFTLGNQARVGVAQLVEALADDDRVSAIGLVLESLGDVAALERAARFARERRVPIVALKLGRSEVGRAAALTHTASLAGPDRLVDAVLRRFGIARSPSIPAFLETLKLLHQTGPLDGNTIASMSCSGGEAVLVADAAEHRDLNLRPLTDSERATVAATLNPLVEVANPLDYHTFSWGDEAALTETFSAMLGRGFDLSMLLLDFPREDRCQQDEWLVGLHALAAAQARTGARAALVATLPECLPEATVAQVHATGIAALAGVEEALDAAAGAARIGRAWATPAPAPLLPPGSQPDNAETLNEWPAKRELAAAGITVPAGELVTGAEAAVAAATRIGFPVALKSANPELAHKTEAGAVRLGLADADQVRDAAEAMAGLGRDFLVEAMVTDAVAELLIGVDRDPEFGPYLVLGSGGVLVELVGDSRVLPLPTTADEVRDAIQSLKAGKLLGGFRGRPAGDLDTAVACALTVARFAEDNLDRLVELDINPLMVRPQGLGAVAADALIRIVM